MSDLTDPQVLKALAAQRRELAPDTSAAFAAFQGKVFADGALDHRTKQIIAVAVAHATQCQWCIRSHTKAALRAGVTPAQLMEAAWVATEMRAGGAYAHSSVMLDTISEAGNAAQRQAHNPEKES
ncbi:MAG: carboxymuconolactone decarboxylase family protein [Leptolyngbya sp. PLA3]|nr:MAG: carboxymuconolactone decarboxylase family protein [Cyanobacteria bacterium CYA]MCE7967495.1 carboxymuconolactone decarboxylase family protein [Leptolyngbya sp. PL-A3]